MTISIEDKLREAKNLVLDFAIKWSACNGNCVNDCEYRLREAVEQLVKVQRIYNGE